MTLDVWGTLCSDGPLFKMPVLGTVPPYVTHVPALETTAVLQLPLLLLYVFVFVTFLLLHSGEEKVYFNNAAPGFNYRFVTLSLVSFYWWINAGDKNQSSSYPMD